jgi:acyl-CoA reductase-like NAD-dependent aldehyde dehydrogenase
MKLFVPTMDAFLVEFADDGRIRFDNEDWSKPSVQERRAIIHAAKDQLEDLKELLDVLESEL